MTLTLNQIMVRMGNACTCCRSLYRSSNMKSAVSSSSSGSERGVSVSGVASSSGYDLEETKSKTNSRMSCASDDSCAINELLEGRMDLSVTLPNSANPVIINVERRTPMLDLLVNISTQYRFNAANYTINAGDHEFKASTPIGSLDVNQISIIAKNAKISSSKGNTPSVPFQTTFRLQVNLPRNQLMVMRVTPNATIAAIKQIICSEKALDANKYQLVRFTGKSEGPQILDSSKTLAFYTLNELTLISNKNLAQIELQYVTSSASQVDMSPERSDSLDNSVIKKSINSLIVSQSNPEITKIDEKTPLSHSIKNQKKRPAPPPPMSSSATLPNKSFSLEKTSNTNESDSIESIKNDSNLKFVEKVSQTPQTTDNEDRPVLNVPKSVNHVRQNSGSDSSGYHESVLSSDSPESSSATTLHKSSSMTETISSDNKKQINNVLNQKSGTKKRRAPPPPTNYSTQDPTDASAQHSAQQVKPTNGHKQTVNDITDESRVVLECMSDVSLPLSTSSSSSGTASDINNRSLSPIVITQTNGSSTPLQTTTDSRDNCLESLSESTQCSFPLDKTIDSQTQNKCEEFNENIVISEQNIKSFERNAENSLQLNESYLSDDNHNVDQQIQYNSNTDIDVNQKQSIDSKEDTSVKDEEPIGLNDEKASDNEITSNTSKSKESLPKAEVSCSAPALAVSHDTELSSHDCSKQVAENSISNVVDNEKPDLNLDVRDNCDKQTNEMVTQLPNNNGLDLEEISIPLPPPSPFQNRNHEENGNSSTDYLNEGQLFVEQLSASADSQTIKALSDENISNQQMITNSDNLITKEESIHKTKQIKQTNDSNETENKSQTTTGTPLIVSDEEYFNKEIEVTLQSLNDELDRLDSSEHQLEPLIESSNESAEDSKTDKTNNEINSVINNNNNKNNSIFDSKTTNVSLHVKQTNDKNSTEIEAIKSIFERKELSTPSPTLRVMTPINETNSKDQFPITTNGKTTLFINNNESRTISPIPRPFSPPITSASPSPTNEDKMSITDEVRHLCRPRVRLTNFSIGSYKKEVDIFESTPVTAPVKSNTKSFVTFPSVKSEEKSRPTLNQSKSKVEITSNSMTATTTTSKSMTPVIQTLITSAPKLNRIQSWSGQKSVTLQEKNIKLPLKTNERYVSQISITKDLNQKSGKESNEDLRSPNLVVHSLTAKIEDQVKSRTPSPKPVIQKMESNKEKITISIKPGLESIICSNSKQNVLQNNSINEKNDKKVIQNNFQKKTTKATNLPKNPKNEEPVRVSTTSPVPPPVPPPIPPPEPQIIPTLPKIDSSKSKSNSKIFHTKGWNSERVARSGEVPKVKHVDPPTNVNVRDQLLNEIKNFGGKNTLKRVSNNSSWKLEVNPLKT